MEIMSAKDARKCGLSQRRLDGLCQADQIENARLIPTAARNPAAAGTARPFLKWAGGKGQLIAEIKKYYPFADKSIHKYAEPFMGGGAVLFDILNEYDLAEAYISDANRDLVNAYGVVQNEVDELIRLLEQMQRDYLPMETAAKKSYYASKRERFNRLKSACPADLCPELAALLIFLNRTCFNGLYRVNRKGRFNVPMGAYKKPLICDEANLRLAAQKLRGVKIVCGDYRQSADFIDQRTFAYFDPPYRPLSGTANFTAYSENAFDDARQIELANFIRDLARTGARILVSNSDPRNVNVHDDFFDRIYGDMRIKRVAATRMINSKGGARGKISELLISNF